MGSPFEVLDGGKGAQGQFVCPWCGSTFERRHIASDGVLSLEEHWQSNPRCKALAKTNNATSSKQGAFEEERIMPGEYTLAMVQQREDEQEPSGE